jgi:hypothetical protein
VAVQDILVYIDNVPQNPSTAYSINTATNQITFTSAPLSGTNNIWVYYNTKQIQFLVPSPGTVGTTQLNNGTVVTSADATINGVTVGLGANSVSNNTVLGKNTLPVNTTGDRNVAIGSNALPANTTGNDNLAIGVLTMASNTSGNNNSAAGRAALSANTTGASNTAFGMQALQANTTASNNTAVGYQAGYSNTTGANATLIGFNAGYTLNPAAGNCYTTFVGERSGYSVTTGVNNTFVGATAGYSVTTGSKNTIIGAYNGNNGGLDIRTASNYIVLSDGDGNPRGYFNNNGSYIVGSTSEDVIGTGANGLSYRASIGNLSVLAASASALGVGRATTTGAMVYFYYNAVAKGSISTDGSNVAYNTSSDYRLKENIVDLPNALQIVSQLKPRQFDWKETKETTTGFIAHELAEICPHAVTGEKDAVDAEGNPVYQGIDTSFLVATLTAAIQELKADNDSMRAALKAAGIAGF